jgi:hypothetical protein
MTGEQKIAVKMKYETMARAFRTLRCDDQRGDRFYALDLSKHRENMRYCRRVLNGYGITNAEIDTHIRL